MLDTEFALALIDLRKRGHIVVAVDILGRLPFEGEKDPLIEQLWALQRSAMYRDMATIGVDIVSWPADRSLENRWIWCPIGGAECGPGRGGSNDALRNPGLMPWQWGSGY